MLFSSIDTINMQINTDSLIFQNPQNAAYKWKTDFCEHKLFKNWSFKEVRQLFNKALGIEFRLLNAHLEKWWKVQDWRIKFRSKQRSLRSHENRTYSRKINILQEKLIEDLRISDRKNSLNIISKSTFIRMNKLDLKFKNM